MRPMPLSSFRLTTLAAVLGLGLALAGCSTVEDALSSDRVDYKSQSANRNTLIVPPDLTQLSRDGRWRPATGAFLPLQKCARVHRRCRVHRERCVRLNSSSLFC